MLVVDDDPDALDFLGTVLRAAGAIVMTSGSVSEATRLLVEQRPTIVVSDLCLPGQDGFDLVRFVRQLSDRALAAIPVVALTAYAGALEEERARREGFDAYLTKPVDPIDLIREVVRLVNSGFDRA